MHDLIVTIKTEDILSDLDLKITVDLAFAKEFEYHIDEIPTGKFVDISPVMI